MDRTGASYTFFSHQNGLASLQVGTQIEKDWRTNPLFARIDPFLCVFKNLIA
jgi:hypothetical protein